MRKHLLQLLFLFIAFPFIKSYADDNKAITIPQTNKTVGYRLQVPETILGDRSGGATDRTNKSFTLSAWVNMDKFTNDSKNKGAVIMGHGPQVHMNYNGSLILSTTETGKLKVISGASNKIDQTYAATISLGTWTYLTLIYNNETHKIAVYKDGVLAGEEIQLSKELELFGDNPCIFFAGGMGFSGLSDELQFFNKALSADEVQQAYKTPKEMPSLTAWYDFNSIDGGTKGSFLNKSTAANKATEQAVFYKYTGTASSDPGLISGGVVEEAPTLAEGRAPMITTYTITLPAILTNGTLSVKAGENEMANGAKVNEGTELTITATPSEEYELEYLKVNEVDFVSGTTYAVTSDVTITVAFNEKPVIAPKAIHVPVINGNTKHQFRFDDIVLGEHQNGTNNQWENGAVVNRGDHRARNFTMSVWIKPLNSTGELFGHAQAPYYGAQGTFGVSINDQNQLVLKARAWINEGRCDGISIEPTDKTLAINEWAFLTVAVDDNARTIKLYKNGVLVSTGDLSQTGGGEEAHGIGLLQDECVFFAGNGGASCDVDEVQVWNKTLSEDEIATSMKSYAQAPENLIAFYKFDENSIENIPNQGTGVACIAGLVAGTTKWQGAPYWADVYTCSNIQATLVDGHILQKFAVNYQAETEHGSFVIKNGSNVVATGSALSQHTILTVEATPADGYQVKAIKVNDVAIEGNTFSLEAESTVTVEFGLITRKITCNITGEGVIAITDDEINIYESGVASIPNGANITLTFLPETNYELTAFTLNEESLIEQVTNNKYLLGAIDADYTFEATFTLISSIENNSVETMTIRYESGMLYVNGMNAGDKLEIYNIAGNQIKTSETSEVNVSDLANGCYLVRVTASNTTKTMKFIKR